MKNLLILLGIVLLSSCEEPYEHNVQDNYIKLIGKDVLFEKDTLVIVDYSVTYQRFYLGSKRIEVDYYCAKRNLLKP